MRIPRKLKKRWKKENIYITNKISYFLNTVFKISGKSINNFVESMTNAFNSVLKFVKTISESKILNKL